MTRAYRLDVHSSTIAGTFAAHQGPDPWVGGALVPGEFAPVIVQSQKAGQRVVRPMVWGYPAPGRGGVSASGAVNWVPTVRNLTSPFWIGNLRHRELRCLVPATSFLLRAKGKSHWFVKADKSVFAMAGIWRDLTDMPVFAVLVSGTTGIARDAGAFAMPVILEPKEQEVWLAADWKAAQHLVTPFTGVLMTAR